MKDRRLLGWKDIVLYLCKWAGLFRISRFLTGEGVRILCYHGFGTGEEVDFRPGTFIRPDVFRRRLQLLRSARYRVVSLEDALDALDRGQVTTGLTVITVDDLFYGFYLYAVPLLMEYGIPATGYLTTYYCVNQEPVFRLLVQFIFWKTSVAKVDFSQLDSTLSFAADIRSTIARRDAEAKVIMFGQGLPTEEARCALARNLAKLLEVDCRRLVASRAFGIVSIEEARELTKRGIDMQLHTHRHRLPENREQVFREIEDNRRVLQRITDAPLRHFCYPSGVWSKRHWEWLKSAGVVSATTCESGLNYSGTPRLALRRILDDDNITQIAFEAEMTGFKSLVRRMLGR
jgi:peptidoglycan/xylan/chitin deacetylase (PgdA/CDA1 family)